MRPEAAAWLCEVFCVPEIVKELLLECPIEEERKFMVVLLRKAIELADEESLFKLLRSYLNILRAAGTNKSFHLN